MMKGDLMSLNELDRPKSIPNRVLDRGYEIVKSFVEFMVRMVVSTEAAILHKEDLIVKQNAFSTAIEATRFAKQLVASDDKDEKVILEAFLEGMIASTKVMQHMGETGQFNDPEQRREALENPTKGSIESPQTSGTDEIESEPKSPSQVTKIPKRGRPLGSKTKKRKKLDLEATRGEE